MSADELRRKAQQRQRKDRFVRLYSIISGLILFVFFAWTFARVHNEDLRQSPQRGGSAHRGWRDESLGHLLCVSGIQMVLAGAASAGCGTEHHGPVLQKRTREASRLRPAHLAQVGPAVPFPGPGDGYRARADQVARRPTAPAELCAVFRAFRHMVRNILSQEEARAAEASTGDRRVTRV